MNILTDDDLSARKRVAFGAGVLVGCAWTIAIAGAGVLFYQGLRAPAPAPAALPAIVMQSANQTVARIPTLRAGERVDCTVAIDQSMNMWSVTC